MTSTRRLIWTTGTLTEADEPEVDICKGVGNGSPARVGLDDGFKFHSAPYSCTDNILKITNLTNYESNNKASGKFAFETHNAASLLAYGKILIQHYTLINTTL